MLSFQNTDAYNHLVEHLQHKTKEYLQPNPGKITSFIYFVNKIISNTSLLCLVLQDIVCFLRQCSLIYSRVAFLCLVFPSYSYQATDDQYCMILRLCLTYHCRQLFFYWFHHFLLDVISFTLPILLFQTMSILWAFRKNTNAQTGSQHLLMCYLFD